MVVKLNLKLKKKMDVKIVFLLGLKRDDLHEAITKI